MYKILGKINGEYEVEFRYIGKAETVSIAGSFNDWDPANGTMTLAEDGESFTLKLHLMPGFHEYKLVIDGEWGLDESNDSFVANDFGTLNSVLELE